MTNQNASTILSALVDDAGHDGWTQSEITKRCEITKSVVGKALKVLVDEDSVEKFKNAGGSYRYRAIVDLAQPASDDDASVDASDAAILAAEGMTPDEHMADDVQNVVDALAPSVEVGKVEEKKARKFSPSHFVAKVAFDMAHDIAEDKGLDAAERVALQEDYLRRSFAKLEDGDAAIVIRKALAKLGGYSSDLTEILSRLQPEYAPARRTLGGTKAPKGTVTSSSCRTRHDKTACYLHFTVAHSVTELYDLWDVVEGVNDEGMPTITLTKTGEKFVPKNKR